MSELYLGFPEVEGTNQLIKMPINVNTGSSVDLVSVVGFGEGEVVKILKGRPFTYTSFIEANILPAGEVRRLFGNKEIYFSALAEAPLKNNNLTSMLPSSQIFLRGLLDKHVCLTVAGRYPKDLDSSYKLVKTVMSYQRVISGDREIFRSRHLGVGKIAECQQVKSTMNDKRCYRCQSSRHLVRDCLQPHKRANRLPSKHLVNGRLTRSDRDMDWRKSLETQSSKVDTYCK